MPASVEAVIEIVARGQREVEAAFDQTGKAMERVAGQTEAVNRRMSVMGDMLGKVQKSWGSLAMAAASFGAMAVTLNRVQKDSVGSLMELQAAVERHGITWSEVESQLAETIITFSAFSAISVPEINRAVADMMVYVGGDAVMAFELMRIAADHAAKQGKTFAEGQRDIQGVMGGDAGTIQMMQMLYRGLENTTGGLEAIASIAPQVEGSVARLTTSFDRFNNQMRMFAERVAGWNESMGGAPVLIMGVTAALVGLAAVVAIVAAAVAAVGGVVVLIVVAVAAIGVAVFLLWKNWRTIWAWIMAKTHEVVNFLLDSSLGRLVGFLGPGGAIILAMAWLRRHWAEVWDAIWGTLVKWWGIVKTWWEEVRAGFEKAWSGIKSVFSGMIDFIAGVFTLDWERAWSGVTKIFTGVKDTLLSVAGMIWAGLKAGLNIVVAAINLVIRMVNLMPAINVPSWVPGIGGQSFGIPNIPEIPMLARGTAAFGGGAAIVGEAGPELVSMPRGAQVSPIGGMQRIIIYLDGRVIAETVMERWTQEVRMQGV